MERIGWVDVSPAAAMAVALAAVAAGLIVGAWVGRARSVVVWGVVLALGVVATSAVDELDVPFTAGVGEVDRTPLTLADVEPSYELTMGELTLDLTNVDLPPGREVPVDVNIGVGQVVVRVAPDVAVGVTASAALGSVKVFGHEEGGVDVDYRVVAGGAEGAGTFLLDVSTVMGEVVVERRP